MERQDRIAIMGAGIGGLATALKLEDSGKQVLIVERDQAPPNIAPEVASGAWDRPGVPQLRMAHSLLARLQTMLRTEHPELLAALASAGVATCPMRFVLPDNQIDGYRERPGDIDLRHLLGRRATFEYVLRSYVAKLPHVRFVHGARVEGLRVVRDGEHLRVTGLNVARGDVREHIPAQTVIDASGSRSKVVDWLRAEGAVIESESLDSDFTYFCRHYRIRDAGPEPFARRTGAVLDYLWFGAFFAEHGHFALALACPSTERELVQAIKTTDGFDAIGRSLPGVSELIGRADPTSRVLGAGDLSNRWTRYAVKGAPQLLGFFAVGDSHVLTNPMYGRGCSAAFVQAQALVDVLRTSSDDVERSRRFEQAVWTQLRPQYEFAIAGEQLFAARGRRARGQAMTRAEHFVDYFTDQVWAPSVLQSPFIARESVKTIQMQEPAGFWTRLSLLLWMFWLWARRGFRTIPLVGERTGPTRSQLLSRLQRTPERLQDDVAAAQ